MPETKKKLARLIPFTLNACEVSGYAGCLGWPHSHDGPCKMYRHKYYQCSECGADDVYGEIPHEDSCSLRPSSSGE